MVKRCHNLSFDSIKDEYWCRSTHVCYKPICYCDLFVKVYQRGPNIITEYLKN